MSEKLVNEIQFNESKSEPKQKFDDLGLEENGHKGTLIGTSNVPIKRIPGAVKLPFLPINFTSHSNENQSQQSEISNSSVQQRNDSNIVSKSKRPVSSQLQDLALTPPSTQSKISEPPNLPVSKPVKKTATIISSSNENLEFFKHPEDEIGR